MIYLLEHPKSVGGKGTESLLSPKANDRVCRVKGNYRFGRGVRLWQLQGLEDLHTGVPKMSAIRMMRAKPVNLSEIPSSNLGVAAHTDETNFSG